MDLSQQLLMAYRKQAYGEAETALKALAQADLRGMPENQKLSFWVNCYNALMQHVLREHPSLWGQASLYTKKHFSVGGQRLSFDDIEHGLLRGCQYKYGFGFVPSPFFSSFIKKECVRKPDCRVHFALNCGAKSCPPIAFYSPESIGEQLETASVSYLEAHTHYDQKTNTVYASRLMYWFSGDFGGPWGVKKLLHAHKLAPKNAKLKFNAYDWSLDLHNWQKIA
jgi:hypothetical protein